MTGRVSRVFLLAQEKYLHQPVFEVEVVDSTELATRSALGLIKFIASRRLSKDRFANPSMEEHSEILLFSQATGAACVEGIGTTEVKLEGVI